MIKAFIFNALNSWFTSATGVVWGGPKIWAGIKGLFDSEAATTIDWKILMPGIGILIAFLMARDWTKALFKTKRTPNAPIDLGG